MKTPRERVDELWLKVQAMDDKEARRVLCFLFGWLANNKDFAAGIEAAVHEQLVYGR